MASIEIRNRPAAFGPARLFGGLGRLASRGYSAFQAQRVRAHLRQLPDYVLEDIGISRSEIDRIDF